MRGFQSRARGVTSPLMKRRFLLPLPFLLPLAARAQTSAPAPALSAQDKTDITRVETYLNSLHNLRARFLQVAPDGRTSEGNAWISRPGRLRFEYDPPSPLLLVAGHGLVVFHDKQLMQTENFMIGQTPLGILLSDNLKLSGDITVTSVNRLPGQLQITVYRTSSPGDGTLTLVFTDPPLALRQWEVVDGQRQSTRVTLFNVELGGTFDSKLFEFIDPRILGPAGGNSSGPRN
jgi:outer membrane lipoprotein-sorting protein